MSIIEGAFNKNKKNDKNYTADNSITRYYTFKQKHVVLDRKDVTENVEKVELSNSNNDLEKKSVADDKTEKDYGKYVDVLTSLFKSKVKPEPIEIIKNDSVVEKSEIKHRDIDDGQLARNDIIIIDHAMLKSRGMVSYDDDLANPVITNEYRLIKHKILNNIQILSNDKLENYNIIMVTSVNPKEGKTFSAINMALSIASEKNNTILLVDANTHNPGVCNTLNINEKNGLIDYLLDNIDDIGSVIYNTNIENLKILPVGSEHHLSNELLSSVKMHDLAKELSQRYPDRVIIFDCPSLLGVVETVTMSKFVGQAIVVVEHSCTKLADIEQGIAELNDELKIGFVVNKAIDGAYSRYGYGYEKKIPNS